MTVRPPTLRVARIADRTAVLGPGIRSVVWVQGCPLHCNGCLAPEAISFEGGQEVGVDAVAERIAALRPRIDGVTFSGGEPFAQAAALVSLSDRLRALRPGLSLMSFSGWTYGALLRRAVPSQLELLDRLDLLIDGPYVARRHAAVRWRGSDNQRLRFLSARHCEKDLGPDETAGLELEVLPDASVGFVGVPPVAHFRDALRDSADNAGLVLR